MDWIERWSDDHERFYKYLSDTGWAQHFHCGWDKHNTWHDPPGIDEGMGMCGKEWAERAGVLEVIEQVGMVRVH